MNLPKSLVEEMKRMSLMDRAAQFSPFAALTGYEDVIDETGRLTAERTVIDESQKTVLDRRLAEIRRRLPEVTEVKIRYFEADARKTGGCYREVCGDVSKIDEVRRVLLLTDGSSISIDDIDDLEFSEGYMRLSQTSGPLRNMYMKIPGHAPEVRPIGQENIPACVRLEYDSSSGRYKEALVEWEAVRK